MLNRADAKSLTLMGSLVNLIVGTHPKLRSRVVYGLQAVLMYAAWSLAHVYSARSGYMSWEGAQFMIAHNLIGMFAFYPLVRSGYSARFQDSGLIFPQIIWGVIGTVAGYYLNPPLRVAYLQLLCYVHVFGLFTLRPNRLLLVGAITITMLLSLAGVMAYARPDGSDVVREVFKLIFASFIVVLITWMSVLHSLARGRLSVRKHELAIAVAQVNEMVTRDPLTGLFNRKHMQELLERERARQQQTGKPFCVAMIDLDHFKRINDEHGHQVGDEVLCCFAKAAVGTLRETDIMARWGGEEFLVLMPDTSIEPDASAAILRVSKLLAYLTPVPSAPALRFTCSAGLAEHGPQETVDQTVARADQALYQAKALGRNRMVLAPSSQVVEIQRDGKMPAWGNAD